MKINPTKNRDESACLLHMYSRPATKLAPAGSDRSVVHIVTFVDDL